MRGGIWSAITRCVFVGGLTPRAATAGEDMDFVAEHLPEALMDDRLLSLPVNYARSAADERWSTLFQVFGSRIESGELRLSGPGAGLGVRRVLNGEWAALGFVFFDRLYFSGATEMRPVAPLFSRSFPVSLPADAILDNQRGRIQQVGAGLALSYRPESRPWSFTFGVVRQRDSLQEFGVDYRLTSGPDAGTAGTLDYSANYLYWIPFGTAEWRIVRDTWQLSPRITGGLPLPKQGWHGRMEGPGFDISGDTADAGYGKHMGDPFAGLGLGVTWLPMHLTLDVGAILSQQLVEPRIHEGVDRAWLLSFSWEP
jgi:hypothetical protein